MSLTSFIGLPDVRARFRVEFPTVPFEKSSAPPLKVPPITGNHALVGTAFDYLLRFYIKRLNRDGKERQWVAERVAADPKYFQRGHDFVMIGKKIEVDHPWRLDYKIAGQVIDQARDRYATYLRNGKVSDDLLRSALSLARLDPLYRSPLAPFVWREPDPSDVLDLQQLLSVVSARLFKAKTRCVLNPRFGKASELVRGGDADLVLDGALIDIKTTKHACVEREWFDQLLGYYLLSRIGGIDGTDRRNRISRLGIYFSRHAYLWTFRVMNVADDRRLDSLAMWFEKRASEEYP